MDKYISDIDLSRFNLFLQQNNAREPYFPVSNLPSLDEMFQGENYYAILFKEWPGESIGHWVVLIKHGENHFEYFDCLGEAPPLEVINLLESSGNDVLLESTSRALMGAKNTICGKWCMFRLLCLPNSLKEFLKFFDSIKKSPDSTVNFIVNLPVND